MSDTIKDSNTCLLCDTVPASAEEYGGGQGERGRVPLRPPSVH